MSSLISRYPKWWRISKICICILQRNKTISIRKRNFEQTQRLSLNTIIMVRIKARRKIKYMCQTFVPQNSWFTMCVNRNAWNGCARISQSHKSREWRTGTCPFNDVLAAFTKKLRILRVLCRRTLRPIWF